VCLYSAFKVFEPCLCSERNAFLADCKFQGDLFLTFNVIIIKKRTAFVMHAESSFQKP
jgi:hypothetical protein